MDGVYSLHVADDGTLPLRPGETIASVMQQRREMELHSYYDSIAEHTFKTRFLPVDEETAKAWRVYNRGGKLTASQNTRLATLKSEINSVLAMFVKEGHPKVFFRMSTRSPKDAVAVAPRCRSKLVELLRDWSKKLNTSGTSLETVAENKMSFDVRLLAVLQDSLCEIMTVDSADAVFELVAHSSRCVSDLVRMLNYREHLPGWDLHLIFRQFVSLPARSEFRCFVHEGRLTAISQYFASSYFPRVAERAPALRVSIERFLVANCIGKVEPHVASYIVDVAVVPAGEDGHERIWIVELNPFAPTTGSCLFDWDKDAEVLHNGPLEIRVVTAPFAQTHVRAMLGPYHSVIKEAGCREASSPRRKSRVSSLSVIVVVAAVAVATAVFVWRE